jgi:glycolate oxidase
MTFLEALRASGIWFTIDRDVLESYSRDQAHFAPHGQALAMVRPSNTHEVQELARLASQYRVALVPRGAGTGVSGAANASAECVIVNFDRMNRIVRVDEAAMVAVVQPGVLNGDLKRAARECGLWYPPDPSSYAISTLGGNVATNAGGLCCVKYGVTRDYVLSLEAVLADGTVIRTGTPTRKNVAGYDLTSLLVGSEGTLAMITEITLRLRRLPSPVTTLVASFASLGAAGQGVLNLAQSSDIALLEIMDRTAIRAVEDFAHLDLSTDAAALLIAQSETAGSAELDRLTRACEAAGGNGIIVTDDEAEGALLVNARRLAFPALERLGSVLIDDVAVPLNALPRMFESIEAIAKRSSTLVATVAHAGDGNLHPLVIFEAGNADAEARARQTFVAIMEQALELDGTITGEHGVGLLKMAELERQLGTAALELQRRVKHLFDPDDILNPGKVIPRRVASA